MKLSREFVIKQKSKFISKGGITNKDLLMGTKD